MLWPPKEQLRKENEHPPRHLYWVRISVRFGFKKLRMLV